MDCSRFPESLLALCKKIEELHNISKDKIDSLQTQVYIISGVGGSVALVLIIILITLAVRLNSMYKIATGLSHKATPTNIPPPTGNNVHQHQPPLHSYAQQPKTITSEEELAQLGFSAYTGHPTDARGISTSPAVSNAGGVRVLPRNPPTGFRQNAAYNDGFM